MVSGPQGWARVDSWRTPSLGTILRPLTLLPITAASAGVYWSGPWWQRLLVSLYGVFGAYLAITVMLYVGMRFAARPESRREVGLAQASELAAEIQALVAGLGIDERACRFFRREGGETAVVPILSPGGSVVFEAALAIVEERDSEFPYVTYGFTGVRDGKRFELHSFALPFPQRGVDMWFDSTVDAEGLYNRACELADVGSEPDIEELGLTDPATNPVKDAGFFRFARGWMRSCWRRRGVIRGF